MRRVVRSTSQPEQLALPLKPVRLQRIEPAKNMARFYGMDVERDLFGRVVLVRQWGRFGTAGRTRSDEHPDEGRALLQCRSWRHPRVSAAIDRDLDDEFAPQVILLELQPKRSEGGLQIAKSSGVNIYRLMSWDVPCTLEQPHYENAKQYAPWFPC